VRVATVHRFLLVALAFACVLPPKARAAWLDDPAVNLPVCAEPGAQSQVECVEDGFGGLLVVWNDARPGSSGVDLYAHHVLASGMLDPAWPVTGLLVCNSANDQTLGAVAPDGFGGLIVAWLDKRSYLSSPDIYAHHVLSSGSVDPFWTANGVPVCVDPGYQYTPVIASDEAGGIYVAWGDLRSGSNDIYAQHILPSGARPAFWPANGLAVCTATGEQYFPSLALDGQGGVLLAWEDDRSDGGDIYASHVLQNGSVDAAWPAQGLGICVQAGAQQSVKGIADGAGGLLLAWRDARGATGQDIYAHRVLGTGSVSGSWPVNGRALCTAPGDQIGPRLASDGAGGALVAWTDSRSGGRDVYGAHVTADGSLDPASGANGAALCVATGDQSLTGFVSDGAGTGYACWQDARAGTTNFDVYAQRLLGSGLPDPTWPANGRAACTAGGNQVSPRVVLDQQGGALLAWVDFRSGTTDIYAQRVGRNSVLAAGGTLPTDAGSWFAAPYPSPAFTRTAFVLTLPAPGRVRVAIFDPAGRRIRSIVDEVLPAGTRSVAWDLCDADGRRVEPGLYFATARYGDRVESGRIIVLR
jgi:hypothetical protein